MTYAQKRRQIWWLVPSLLFFAGGASTVGSQRPGGGAAGDVLVDFVAMGASGQPVTDLQAADVSVKIAGKVRTVASLDLKRFDSGGAAAPVSSAPAPFATNTASNANSRSILIVIDNESLRAGTERSIRESLDGILKGLGSADRVALSFVPRDTAQVGFGAGVQAARDALAKFNGSRPASVPNDEALCRTRDSLVAVKSLLEPLGGNEKPTTVLFVSSGLSLPSRASGSTGQSCEVTTDHYQALAGALASARGNLYVIQGDEAVTGRNEGLETLAGAAGAGAVLRTTGQGLGRVQAEGASYYVATVKADPADRVGQVQRLEVKVNRDGVTTRARGDVAIGRATAAGAGAKPGSTSAADMVRNAAAFNDLQLRATAIVGRGPAGKMAVLIFAEPVDPAVKLKEMRAGAIDSSNKIPGQTAADDKQIANRPTTMQMAVDPGKYRLRVAAVDDTGKSGAVDVDLNAELTPAGAVKLGGLMLVGPRGQAFAPQLVFSTEAEIGFNVEMYGQIPAGKQVGARIEIAASPDGPAIGDPIQPGGSTSNEPDRFILQGKIPIAKLAPGDYVVRLVLQIEGEPEGRVYRTLRKVAK